MGRTRTLLVAGGFATMGAALWLWLGPDSAEDAPPEDAKLLVNRVWAERIPADERDMVGYLVPIRVGGRALGMADHSSRWRSRSEFFTFALDGTRLELVFPQERSKVVVKARTWTCPGEAPKGFDLCLELTSGKRSKRMYSRRAWLLPRDEAAPDDLPVHLPADLGDRPVDACEDCEEGTPSWLLEAGL